MKKLIAAALLCTLSPATHAADYLVTTTYGASAFVGLTWTFGPNGGMAGATAKFVSTNEPDKLAAAAGVTYYFDGSFGCDVGAAFTSNDVTLTAGYDLCLGGMQVGLGALTSDPKVMIEGLDED